MLSPLNPVVGLLMLRSVLAEGESVAARQAGSTGRSGARVQCRTRDGDRPARPPVRSGTYGGCWHRSRAGAVAQPHWAPVGQKELSALVSGSRTWAGARAAGPVARIAYSVPSAASKRWSTT